MIGKAQQYMIVGLMIALGFSGLTIWFYSKTLKVAEAKFNAEHTNHEVTKASLAGVRKALDEQNLRNREFRDTQLRLIGLSETAIRNAGRFDSELEGVVNELEASARSAMVNCDVSETVKRIWQ